jgi:hypothetical protein
MRHVRLAVIAVAAALVVTRPAAAQNAAPTASHRAAVARLLVASKVRETTEQTLETMLAAQLRQMPQQAQIVGVLRDFHREQMSWAVLEPEYTRLYLEVFDEADARELVAFYESPLGQKMLDRMPVLMEKSTEMTTRRMQAAMPQLMQRLQAAIRAPAARSDSASARKP